MSNIVEITMGKLYIASSPMVLSTSGIGSCVAICLYSQAHKKGALAHAMLPQKPASGSEVTEDDFRFADIAVKVMVNQLEEQGVMRRGLVAKVVGGANMFPGIQARSQKMGQRNVDAAKQALQEFSIPVAAEETGGTTGRAIVFDLGNGIVTVKMTI